jgi:uncharacterized membrane protein YadS
MIIPISLIFAAIVAYKKKKETKLNKEVDYNFFKIFPWFILWFFVASILNTIGIFKGDSIEYINIIGKFMIVMALSAIGLSSDFKAMIKSGFKPILLGLIVWFNVAIVSILVQFITGQI